MTDTTVPAPAPVAPTPGEVRQSIRERVAKEMFGNEYFSDTEAPKAPETPTEPDEEPKPADTEAGEEAPPIEEPTEGEEPEEGAETAPEDTGETPIETLSELVEHYELDPEYVRTLKVQVTVDGTPTEATIGDLVKSYQITEAAEHRLEDAKAVARKESEAWAAKHEGLDAQFQVLAELIKVEEASLERDVKAVDPRLRDEDPAEWAARVQEFQARRAHIAQVKNATVERYISVAQERTKESENIKNQFMAEEHKVLLDKLPEWQDPKRAETEKLEIADYLIRTGFQPQELSNLIDHRQVMIARKAMLYDKSRGSVDTAKKRVAKVPKVMKPGAPKPAEQRASERLASLKAKMQQTGSDKDALAYTLAKRGVSR